MFDWNYITINYYYYYLLFIFSVFIILLCLNFKYLIKPFKKIRKKTWIFLILIFLFAFVLRMWYAPHVYRIFPDEFYLKDSSYNLYEFQKYQVCYNFEMNSCDDYGVSPLKLPVSSFLLSFVFYLSDNIESLFSFVAVISSLSVVVFFFFFFLVSKKENLSLLASLLLAVLPVQIRYAGSISVEVFSLFFLLLCFSFFLLSFKVNKIKFFSLFFITLIILLQTRYENFILIIFFIIWYLMELNFKIKRINFNLSRSIFLFLFFFLMSFSLGIFQNVFSRSEVLWMSSLEILKNNLLFNIPKNIYFLTSSFFNASLMILFIVGLIVLFSENKKLFVFLTSFFLTYFFLFSSHYSGVFNLAVGSKYLIILLFPIIIGSIFGIDFLIKLFNKSSQRRMLYFLFIVYLILVPFQNQDYIFILAKTQAEYVYLSELNVDFDCQIFAEDAYGLKTVFKQTVYPINYLYDYNFIKQLNTSCLLLYENSVLFYDDFNVSDVYYYLNLTSYEKSSDIYEDDLNPFFQIEDFKYNLPLLK